MPWHAHFPSLNYITEKIYSFPSFPSFFLSSNPLLLLDLLVHLLVSSSSTLLSSLFFWFWVLVFNGNSWGYWGLSIHQHSGCHSFPFGLCSSQNSACEWQGVLSQMVPQWSKNQPKKRLWQLCGQVCQSQLLDLLHFLELDASSPENDWGWDYQPCWPWLCCFPQNLHFGVTSIFFSSISFFVWFSDQVLEFWVIYHGFMFWASSKVDLDQNFWKFSMAYGSAMKVWNITPGSSFPIYMEGSFTWISLWALFVSWEIMFGMQMTNTLTPLVSVN